MWRGEVDSPVRGINSPARGVLNIENVMRSRNKKRSSAGTPGSSTTGTGSAVKTKAVDLVTGKETVQYFFDPSLLISESKLGDTTSSVLKQPKSNDRNDPKVLESRHLFVPCSIIKPLDNENTDSSVPSSNNSIFFSQPYAGPTLVKTEDGTLHKIYDSSKLISLHAPDDYIGVADVLHLPKISEESLLHTLRLRYKRDDVYTQAGQILISINPYKNLFIRNPSGEPDRSESLYSEKQMTLYQSYSSEKKLKKTGKDLYSKSCNSNTLPPHLFQVADRAYTALMDSIHTSSDVDHMEDDDAVTLLEHPHYPGQVRDQSIVISGESGAGKTEATKIIMQFLARMTKHTSSVIKKIAKKSTETNTSAEFDVDDNAVTLEDRVLSCNPLLETFGNAQTLRNNNSSRFGKFIRIDFSTESGSITGASISNYLLEKTRITSQVDGERNYHIFYQLFAGMEQSRLEELGLHTGMSSFKYLKNRQQDMDARVNELDAKAFSETCHCLTSIGLSEQEQNGVFGIAAAVLHLGNIEFEENIDDETHSESAKIKDSSVESLNAACTLLGLDSNALSEAILTKSINVNGKIIKKSQRVSLAEDKRDALAKMTYSNLFVWLVKCINDRLNESSSRPIETSFDGNSRRTSGFIGVLDIYGFEFFDTNGFEQLLINYCNEKLQRHFNRHLFEVEQELYASEGVDWSYISFNDNRPCLELIEGGGSGGIGILNTLDDAWGGMGTSAEKDSKFVTQLHKMFGTVSGSETSSSKSKSVAGDNGHPNFVTPKFGSDLQFIIKHYAGEVRYTVDCFVEKNMETMSNELRELGERSTAEVPNRIYTLSGDNANQRSTIRGISVGSQFRTSLQALVTELESTQPHYIRCIKPNLDKAPSRFMAGEVLKQLRYSGMMEAIRIRQEGYALREDHETFYDRFSVLLSSEDTKGEDIGVLQLVKVLSKRLNVSDADWQVGHTKIFLRRELADKLERLAKLRVRCAARTISMFAVRVVHKRLSRFLVAWTKFRLHQLRKKKIRNAANSISSNFRMYRQRNIYKRIRLGFIMIQSHQRRKASVKRVRKIRDPYCDMSFRDCKRMLSTLKGNLELAVKEKDFRKAALLEQKISSVAQAVELKRPLTRAVIDQRIADMQIQLDDAVFRKAFTECAPLQDELEDLLKKQAELPTIEELRDHVAAAEAEMATAAKNRDFVAAAEAQVKIDEAQQKLSDLMAAMDEDSERQSDDKNTQQNAIGCESRAQLESDIAKLTIQIQEAITTKDFSKASKLQSILDEREKMRQLFPTYDELIMQLSKAKHDVEEAIAGKDFEKAGRLSDIVENLEKRIKLEASTDSTEDAVLSKNTTYVPMITTSSGEEFTFHSRFELDQQIQRLSASVADCVKQKQFKKAEQLQLDVDKMCMLKQMLPSIGELQEKIKAKKAEMEKAIENKAFSVADKINSQMEQLEEQLKHEISLAPTLPTIQSRSVDAMSVKSVPVKAYSTNKLHNSLTNFDSVSVPEGTNVLNPATKPISSKPVAKLRPALPVVSKHSDTVLAVIQLMTSKRSKSCIIVGSDGNLAGIMTDTDVTRRVVAKHVDATITAISEVMTPNPKCVTMTDSAMDALAIMVENRFRHLPVTNSVGSIAGVLDISKCLNDAIAKLEQAKEKESTNTETVVKQALKNQGAKSDHVYALLGNLLAHSLGNNAVPTLRKLLTNIPKTIVNPDTSIRQVGELMGESRKPALIVEHGTLVGILSFKDMMTRAVAKQIPLDTTSVSTVMTPSPETVSPDISVLDALQLMYDHRFLTLPVCEKDGKVVGLVDVMDVMYGSGGVAGWKSIFGSAMDIQDDVSDMSSVRSFPPNEKNIIPEKISEKATLEKLDEMEDDHQVSMLRPSKPILSNENDSVLAVAKNLTLKRVAASVITSAAGDLVGIVTDTDLTRRVVAKYLDPNSTFVSRIMTKNPKFVAMEDPAKNAITIMVENNFRHLPVVDRRGAVVGLLDIAKCLTSVINKLERLQNKNGNAVENEVKKVIGQHGVIGEQADAIKSLLSSVLSQSFGEKRSVPTLRSLLGSTPRTIVHPETTVREAGFLMAERRQATLVVDKEGKLVGLFGFKDMMTRVLAKELIPEMTLISEVMTPSPESVSPDITVLDALQTMHDHKFLTLPVCEDDGRVLGIVNVMDVIASSGGAAEGWRSLFGNVIEMTDDMSDSASVQSPPKSLKSGASGSSQQFIDKNDRTVAKLRPSKPLLSASDDTILDVAKLMQQKRGTASLIVDRTGSLAGIVTDTDVTRRVVAKHVELSKTVSEIMTKNPMCVQLSDSATEALTIMVENHFRHLPVVDEVGSVVGLLDIAKCLNNAISKLEQAQSRGSNSAEDVVKNFIGQHGGNDARSEALQALLSNVLLHAFGNSTVPSLRSLLADKTATTVTPTTSIREAAIVMAEKQKAALVVENGELLGIFSFKDLMVRVVANELDLDATFVSQVMTPNPESVTPDTTVLEALQTMHDHGFLTLPVCEDDGTVLGLVDVMDVIYGCGASRGWRSIFSSAMDLDDASVAPSVVTSRKSSSVDDFRRKEQIVSATVNTPFVSHVQYRHDSSIPEHIPKTLEFEGLDDEDSLIGSTLGESNRFLKVSPSESGKADSKAVFKVTSPSGTTHRVKCELRFDDLLQIVSVKIGLPRDTFQIQYEDDEGDAVIMTGDDDVVEAWNLARKAGNKIVKLTTVSGYARTTASSGGSSTNNFVLASTVAIGLAAAAVLLGRKK